MKGLYVHIPFCVKKCDYCDFVSFSDCNEHFDEYINAVLREMKTYKGTDVDTVFIGGGTPSILSPNQIEILCCGIRNNFNIARNVEWTMEMNPGTVTAEKIHAMLMGGVNRASVGVQSFNDCELKAVGRIHTSKTAYDTVNTLYEEGFRNISIDLMESLPFQTKKSLRHTLDTALSLPITHMSVYSLIIEEKTPIKDKYDKGIYKMPDDDYDRDLYKLTGELLREHGFNQYEISNYAKSGFESKHNLKYWNCDEYIGIGDAAHSYVGNVRYYNTSDLSEYLKGVTRIDEVHLLRNDEMGEFMMLGLRKNEGVNVAEFYTRFGVYPYDVWQTALDKFTNLGLMAEDDGFYKLTDRGRDVSNSVMCEFV